MSELLTSGSMLACTFGSDPAPFQADALPGKPIIGGLPTATILEIVPDDNIPSFTMCSSEENPEVAAATAAADGELTPMLCQPATSLPWEPGSLAAAFSGTPLATVTSKCKCAFGGEIAVVTPGQFMVMVAG